MIAFGVRPWTLNIFGTLLLGLLAIWGWDHHRWWAVVLALSLAAIQLWLPAVGPDYGLYGVLLCLASFVLFQHREQLVIGHGLLHVLAGILFWPSQVYALASIPFILWPPRLHLRHLPELFYAYYPAHLALLVLCLLYTSDAADDLLCVDLGGRRIINKKKKKKITTNNTT